MLKKNQILSASEKKSNHNSELIVESNCNAELT